MEKLSYANEIRVTKSGAYELVCTNQTRDIALVIEERIQAQVYLKVDHAESINLKITCGSSSNSTVVFWNDQQSPLQSTDLIEVKQDATLNLVYAELSMSDVNRTIDTYLVERGAQVNLYTAMLAAHNKQTNMVVHHVVGHTTSHMKNYAVMLEGGSCYLRAVGKIEKGASGSKSHQISRGLTFDQQKKAVFLPELLIDENDVEASHAMSLGQMDENQMYYLQSRGLSRAQAVQLVTTGYLLSIVDVFENEEIKEMYKEEVAKKVSEWCSM